MMESAETLEAPASGEIVADLPEVSAAEEKESAFPVDMDVVTEGPSNM